MKLLILLFITFLAPALSWSGNFENARKEAVNTNKLLLVNFSGSDWCGPCIRLRSEILEHPTFEQYATENLVLVRADFPRQKKNRLSNEQVKLNEALAAKYNPDGKFPLTLLVDGNGRVLKTWDGFPDETATAFVEEVKKYSHVAR